MDPIREEYRRSANWIENTSRSLLANFSSLRQANAMYMTVRLSRVLLERLPPDIGFELMDMLPESLCLRDPEWDELKNAASSEPDLTLGYQDLVETAEHSLIEPMTAPASPDFFQRAVDFFLWAFAMELGLELKERIARNLPVDIRTRMNLFSGFAEEAKVA